MTSLAQRKVSHLVGAAVDPVALPPEARDRLAAAATAPDEVTARLQSRFAESLMLATCARFELVAVTTTRCARHGLMSLLADLTGLPPEQLGPHVVQRSGTDVARHLSRVAAGLESPVLGEPEVLGQVRRAGEVARTRGALGPELDLVVATALRAGRRARAETGLARGALSLAAATVERIAATLGGVRNRRALVVGAGDAGTGVATALAARGVQVTVLDRTASRAAALAGRLKVDHAPWSVLACELRRIDIAVFATAAPQAVISVDAIATAREGRAPIVVVDLGLPRNVTPAATTSPAVVLHDLVRIQEDRRTASAGRAAAVEQAEAIVEEEVRRFERSRRRRVVSPVIASLIARGNAIADEEVDRALDEGDGLASEAVLRRLAERIVAKAFDRPVRYLASEADGIALARSVTRLFELDTPA